MIMVTLSKQAQEAAARAGEPAAAVQRYDLPADLVGRALDMGATVGEDGAVTLRYGLTPEGVPGWTVGESQRLSRRPMDAVDALDLIEADRARLAAEELAKGRRVVAEYLTGRYSYGHESAIKRLPEGDPLRREAEERLAAEQAEHAAQWERQRLDEAERERDRSERQEQEAEREAAAERERLAWIEAHGSDRLRRLVREEIEYTRVYGDERLAAERAGWSWCSTVCGDSHDLRGTSVTPAHLAALDAARQVAPDAKLDWWGDGDHVRGCQCPTDEYTDGPTVRGRVVLTVEYLGRWIVREID